MRVAAYVAPALVLLLLLQSFSCGAPCAVGPLEIRAVGLTSSAGAELNELIAFPEEGIGLFNALHSDSAPKGVSLTLEERGVQVRGSVQQAATYAFQILVQAQAGNQCAPWARYEVVLEVH